MQEFCVIDIIASCVPFSTRSMFCDSTLYIKLIKCIETMTCHQLQPLMKTMLLIPSMNTISLMKTIFKNAQFLQTNKFAFSFC